MSQPGATDSTPLAGRRAVVITVSTRAAAGVYEDRSGPLVMAGLAAAGAEVSGPIVVPDGAEVSAALRSAIDSGADLVLTTGGTGINPSDQTPQLTRELVEVELPQVAAALAHYGVAQGVPTAILSRAVVGVVGRSFVANLPGSTGGVRDGLAVLLPILPHALSQLAGGDHEAGAG